MEIRKILTESPKVKPDESNLGFGKYFTDHMFTMDYTAEKGWHNATIEPHAPFLIEPAAMVFHYGQAVFEGMKCYRKDDGTLLLFRPEKNWERLNTSNDRLCIPEIEKEYFMTGLFELLKIDADWVPKSTGSSLYVRPVVFATEPALGVHPSHQYKFMILLSPVGHYYPEGINPVKISIEDTYVRAVKGGTGYTKGAPNYASSMKGQEKANAAGYAQVLWLDGIEHKYIEEVGTSNVFFKIDGKIMTPELGGSILPGITRDSSIALLKDWGFDVEEGRITVDELREVHASGKLEEVFCTGTAAVVSPVGLINHNDTQMVIGNNEIGPVSRKLYDQLTGLQYGKLDDKFGWVREVK